MEVISVGYISNFILNLFIFLLLVAVYTYILKLEDTACACAKHPNRDFIKQFSIFALVFLLTVSLVPMKSMVNTFGLTVTGIFAFVKFIFYIVCIVYFYLILDYTRYLINEKCKCSDDYRREFIMAGSIIEITIFFLILLVIIVLPILVNSVTILLNNMGGLEREVSTAVKNPYESIKTVPNKLKSATRMVKTFGKKSSDVLKKMMKPNKY